MAARRAPIASGNCPFFSATVSLRITQSANRTGRPVHSNQAVPRFRREGKYRFRLAGALHPRSRSELYDGRKAPPSSVEAERCHNDPRHPPGCRFKAAQHSLVKNQGVGATPETGLHGRIQALDPQNRPHCHSMVQGKPMTERPSIRDRILLRRSLFPLISDHPQNSRRARGQATEASCVKVSSLGTPSSSPAWKRSE